MTEKLDEIKRRLANMQEKHKQEPMFLDLQWAADEIERLQDGYRWLEGLAEGRGITITVQPEDGSLEISSDIHSLYNHVDLKDLCVAESAQAAEASA